MFTHQLIGRREKFGGVFYLLPTPEVNREIRFGYFAANLRYDNELDIKRLKGEGERTRRRNLLSFPGRRTTDDTDFSLDGLVEIVDNSLQTFRREDIRGVYHLVVLLERDGYFFSLLDQNQADADRPEGERVRGRRSNFFSLQDRRTGTDDTDFGLDELRQIVNNGVEISQSHRGVQRW